MFFLSQLFSADCDLVQSFAIGLNFHISNPVYMIKMRLDCCSAYNVVCSGNTVVVIRWDDVRLNGTINQTAIPLNIKEFDVGINSIYGELPKIDQFLSLNNFRVDINYINGTIDALPPNLIEGKFNDNNLSGSLPLFTEFMILFGGADNMFTGSIPDNLPLNVQLKNNYLTGTVPILREGMKSLRLASNLLSGEIPIIPSTLIVLTIGSNSRLNRINGSLYFNAPTDISLFNNLITSIVINDTSKLSICDLSYNPIPSDLTTNLTMCNREATGVSYIPFKYNLTQSSTINDMSTKIFSLPVTTSTKSNIQMTFTTVVLKSSVKSILKSTMFSTIATYKVVNSFSTYSTYNTISINNTSIFVFNFYFDAFNIIKLIVDTLVLMYLIKALVKRSKPRKNLVFLNKSDL